MGRQLEYGILHDTAEHIRLVIWDLDEVFWQGTLTEGGITYLQAHHDTVIALAQRGIMSAICSRNDHAEIERILRDRGLWDYFIFPSIDWSSKGPRLKQLIESVQLRAPTVLFIDDNPMNLAEAARYVDGIQIAGPEVIAGLLASPLCTGKDDHDLTRLAQYKLLEQRAEFKAQASSDDTFLRDSDIRVSIDHDIDKNIDRAIELINRTNQLNFTKLRLPEEQDAARHALRVLLSGMDIQAGLVRVVDRYGDYGYCGIYIQRKGLHAMNPHLIHYCFSCRTLGMEVETWLYQRLGRPEIQIQGTVLTDITRTDAQIDWIRVDDTPQQGQGRGAAAIKKIPRIYIRGGCEMVAMAHYFELLTEELVQEFAFQRHGMEVRFDHSQMFRLAVDDLSDAQLHSLRALGYQDSDFQSRLLEVSGASVYIFGFWAEPSPVVYRHREQGFRVQLNIGLPPALVTTIDPNEINLADFEHDPRRPVILPCIHELKNFEYEGTIAEHVTKDNLSSIIQRLPPEAHVFLLGATRQKLDPEGQLIDVHRFNALNNVLGQLAAEDARVTYLRIDDYVADPSERDHGADSHFARSVYFRLFEDIRDRIQARIG